MSQIIFFEVRILLEINSRIVLETSLYRGVKPQVELILALDILSHLFFLPSLRPRFPIALFILPSCHSAHLETVHVTHWSRSCLLLFILFYF